mmetsp:Transcript_27603/g.77146  ORF Transcript_27603/g.77146 Transcript_27603/m.77146 type:complete len:490 (+) Transcript_27603:99-1568(+)
MATSSSEVNFLVYRYLVESGFSHSAFTFAAESSVAKGAVSNADVPRGALITYLQKGLQWRKIESHITDDGHEIECEEEFSLLATHKCKGKKVKKRKRKDIYSGAPKSKKEFGNRGGDVEMGMAMVETGVVGQDVTVYKQAGCVCACEFTESDGKVVLASGSDVLSLWDISLRSSDLSKNADVSEDTHDFGQHPVTCLQWNSNGTQLAVACRDGIVRVYSLSEGKLMLLGQLGERGTPIVALKWNLRSTKLATGSVSGDFVIWNAKFSDDKKKEEPFLRIVGDGASVLDVDWRSNFHVASCGVGKIIRVWELGKETPVREIEGHKDVVNAIQWDPSHSLLASCSDDKTVKISTFNQGKCVHTLIGHSAPVYDLHWSPTGPGSKNPLNAAVLASGGGDGCVFLWDVDNGTSLLKLAVHRGPVTAVKFSPDGKKLVSGSFDTTVNLWTVSDGSLEKSYHCGQSVESLNWSESNVVVAGLRENLAVISLKSSS